MSREPLSMERLNANRALLLFCIMMLASGVSSVAVTYGHGIPFGADFDASEPTILIGLILCSAFGLSLAIGIGGHWFGWSQIRWAPVSVRHLVWAFVGVPIALGCSFGWASVLASVTEAVEPQMFVQAVFDVDSVSTVMAASVYAVLGAPILEEVLFRGLMLPAMTKQLGIAMGITLNSVLFGLIHAADPWAIVPAAAIGIIACGLRVRSGSIGASVLFHSLNNLSALLLLAAGY